VEVSSGTQERSLKLYPEKAISGRTRTSREESVEGECFDRRESAMAMEARVSEVTGVNWRQPTTREEGRDGGRPRPRSAAA